MKKIIAVTVLVIVVAVAGGVYYVYANLDALVEAAIEQYGSEATQTAVRVDKVKINLAEGAGSISGLTIANPKGYAMPLAFSLGQVRAGIDLQSLQQQPYVINEITVLAPQVFVEINEQNKTNLNQIKNNLTAGAPAATADKKTSDQTSAAEPRLIIRRITFADGDIKARVAALDNKEYDLKLPALELTNLGGKQGATAEQLAHEIMNRLIDNANEHVKKKIIEGKLGELKGKAQEKIDAEKAQLKEKTDTKLQQEKDQAKDKLKGLFAK